MGDGTIVGAVMSVSGNRKDELERTSEPGPFLAGCSIYDNVDSPLYMDCLKVVSNHAQGGSQIAFNANGDSKPLSEKDREVLFDHGYNPESRLKLHPKLTKLAGNVAKEFSKFGVAYSGQDWMQDQQGNFHFIELNAGPGMEIFNTLYNRGEGDDKTAMAIGSRKLAEALKDYQVERR